MIIKSKNNINYYLFKNKLVSRDGIPFQPRTLVNENLSIGNLVQESRVDSHLPPTATQTRNIGFWCLLMQARIQSTAIGLKVPEGLEANESVKLEVRTLVGSHLRIGDYDDSIRIG